MNIIYKVVIGAYIGSYYRSSIYYFTSIIDLCKTIGDIYRLPENDKRFCDINKTLIIDNKSNPFLSIKYGKYKYPLTIAISKELSKEKVKPLNETLEEIQMVRFIALTDSL